MKFIKNLLKKPASTADANQLDENPESTTQKALSSKANEGRQDGINAKKKTAGQKQGGPKKPKNKKPPAEPVVRAESDFSRMNLPEPLLAAIDDMGFIACTPVQKEVVPHALDGEDVIAQAQTGTGKTAAFLISIITYHLENPEDKPRAPGTPYALIVAPTRELVMQISSDAENLTRHTDITTLTVVGGIDYERQKTQLKKPVDIMVATPGRLLDFCRSRIIDLSQIEILVLDEADRMLSMGFIPDVKSIIGRTPHKDQRQTQLFSATFNDDIKRLAQTWTKNAIWVEIEPEHVAVDSVEQLIYMVSEDHKFDVLYNIVTREKLDRIMVFVNRRDDTRELEARLSAHGLATGLLTGEVPQRKRIRTLDDFKSGKIKVLVATDVAGRGIHVDAVSHVINYNLPEDPEDYVHRIGRTGRAGATGTSITLACETESFMLPELEKLLGEPLKCVSPPEELMEVAPPSDYKPEKKRYSGNKRSGNNRGSQRRR